MKHDHTGPVIIAGPCSAETREQILATCTALAQTGRVHALRAGVWKPRTRPGSFEGAGEDGLEWLVEAGRITGLPVAVEVANSKHVEAALRHGVDMVWLGARTTVSPFSVQEIAEAVGKTGLRVMVKNPLTPDAELWSGAVSRLAKAGVDSGRIGLIHRGFSYPGAGPYRNTPMWHLALEMRRRWPGLKILCDPSHMAGRTELLREVSQRAADLRYDGLIIESHVCPAHALSDSRQQVTPAGLAELLDGIVWRQGKSDDRRFGEALERLRSEIDRIDSQIFDLLGQRMGISGEIGRLKSENNVAILQEERWEAVAERIMSQSEALGLSREFLRIVLDAVHMESIARQNRVMNE